MGVAEETWINERDGAATRYGRGSRMLMKVAMKHVLLFVALFLLGSCCTPTTLGPPATTGPKFSEHKAQVPVSNPDIGRIYFYTKWNIGPRGPDVLLNNEIVGKMATLGFFYVDRSPGNYVAALSFSGRRIMAETSFTLEKGLNRYIRLDLSKRGIFYPELVDEQVALSEMSECRFTGQTE
jgi:hypothetical protein